MKRLMVMISMVAVVLFATQAFSADKAAISKNVDEVVAGINGGKVAASFAPGAYTPFVFIMEANGNLIVHPTLAGKDLKVEGKPIYEAVKDATPQGAWVKYERDGKENNTYIKRTGSNLIVGSGY